MIGPNDGECERRAAAYLVGGGVAALASATYLIRDGGFEGRDILILEEAALVGGSLDCSGSAEAGYVTRGARMFTYDAYAATLELLSFIPALSDPAWRRVIRTSAVRRSSRAVSTNPSGCRSP